jgi:creatinine amidohydrolase
MRYEFTKPKEYHATREKTPVAYLPWGAHEWHGFHDPLGLDTLKAHGHALALCAETGGIVFPQVYCGTQTMKPYRGFDATLDFSHECVRLLCAEYLSQLADEGFKVIVIILGHYGPDHVETIQEAVAEFNDSQDGAIAWAFPDYAMTRDDGIDGDHAGATETSYMLYFHPELVDLSRLTKDGELNMEEDGVGGLDPRTHASAKLGRDATNILVKNAAAEVRRLLEQIAG